LSEPEIVGDDHGAAARALLLDRHGNTAFAPCVLTRRGLVEDENGWLRGHGGRDGDEALCLGGEVPGVGVAEFVELDGGECLPCAIPRSAVARSECAGAERDLLDHGPGEELAGWILEDETDVPRAAVHWKRVDAMAIDVDAPRAQRYQPHDRTRERRLPRAVVADDGGGGAPGKLKR
jgi:hypothetical protein